MPNGKSFLNPKGRVIEGEPEKLANAIWLSTKSGFLLQVVVTEEISGATLGDAGRTNDQQLRKIC